MSELLITVQFHEFIYPTLYIFYTYTENKVVRREEGISWGNPTEIPRLPSGNSYFTQVVVGKENTVRV